MLFFDISTSNSGLNLVCFVHFGSRHNGVHFFFMSMSTSKGGLKMLCFVHFDLETCFALQRRAIFHLSSDHMAPHPRH